MQPALSASQPKQYISPTQAAFLSAMNFLLVALLSYTRIYFLAGRTAWVTAIMGMLVLLPLALWMLYLANLYPGNTIFKIIEITIGQLISRLLTMIFIFLIVISAACT